MSLGADVDVKDVSGATPLRLAQSFGHKKVEVTLLSWMIMIMLMYRMKTYFAKIYTK